MRGERRLAPLRAEFVRADSPVLSPGIPLTPPPSPDPFQIPSYRQGAVFLPHAPGRVPGSAGPGRQTVLHRLHSAFGVTLDQPQPRLQDLPRAGAQLGNEPGRGVDL